MGADPTSGSIISVCPNGIPQTPEENRKAVHTEDHPLGYLEWGGVGGDPLGGVRGGDDEDLGLRDL
jgi:hypothetical protein